jgi:hypothetical protein
MALSRRPFAESFQEPWWVAQMSEAQRAQAGKEAHPTPTADPPALEYCAGLDLGQSVDFSVLTQLVWDGNLAEPTFTVFDIRRWPLQTRYSNVAEDVREALARIPGKRRPALAADKTGVGASVLELFSEYETAFDLFKVQITAGAAVTRSTYNTWNVAKRELISVLIMLFTSGRLKINPELPLASVLAQELRDFTLKITRAGTETFQAATERTHDDTVMSLSLDCWVAQNRPRGVLDAYV